MGKVIANGTYKGIERRAVVILEDGLPIIELDYEFDGQVQAEFDMLLKTAPALVDNLL